MLRELDAHVAALGSYESTLGDWLVRADAGRLPLVVDRLALAAAGLGPGSTFVPRSASTGQPESAQFALEPLGLNVIPLDAAVLVTTQNEAAAYLRAPVTLAQLAPRLRMAASSGADEWDRFLSVSSWRREPTPAALETPQEPSTAGWNQAVFETTGLPSAGAFVRLGNRASQSAWAAALGTACLALGLAGRRRPARLRAACLAILLAGSWLLTLWAPPSTATLASGALGGTVAVLALWFACSARTRRDEPRDSSRRTFSSTRSWPPATDAARAVAVFLLVLNLTALAADNALEPGDENSRPIVAILPFDGLPDLEAPQQRVLLLLRDEEQLKAWAGAGAGAANPAVAVVATMAEHRVRWQDVRDARVESRYELGCNSSDLATWILPIDQPRDLSATLDNEPVPLRVEPDGKSVRVPITGKGDHILRVTQLASPIRTDWDESLSVPVGAVAGARLVVENLPGGVAVELTSARGRVAQNGSTVEALLGPAPSIQLRRPPAQPAGRKRPGASVEGTLLWDAMPSGDRLRARLKFRDPAGISLVRLALDPRAVVRSVSVAGLVEANRQGDTWEARIEPPLPDGESLTLDLWRPAPDEPSATAEVRANDDEPARADETKPVPRVPRQIPQLEPLGVERYSGVVALRRPSHWAGALDAKPGLDAAGVLGVLESLGLPPTEELVGAGGTRFSTTPQVAAVLGQVPTRHTITQTVQLTVEAGRVALAVEGELSDVEGESFALEAVVPHALQVDTLDAEGLISWSRPSP
ncbi:MAG TPA: hypothetical protein VGY53_04490, partial [Isosphaeraceae bacterium]|nr:hypothetical protein [Isosphaeraceae bacterium]